MDGEGGAHCVFFAGGEGDGGAEDVARFYAEHVLPLVVAEVGEGRGALLPGVPDDGSGGVELLCPQAAVKDGVEDLGGEFGVDVGVVGGTGEGEGAILALGLVAVGVVEVGDGIESADAGLLDVADAEIRVQGFFKTERGGAAVHDAEFEAKRRANADAVGDEEVVRPEGACGVVAGGNADQSDGAVVVGAERVEPPLAGADESVAGRFGVVGFGPEPGEADGDAAADGFAGFEMRLLAEEEEFLVSGGTPTENLRAVEGDFRMRSGAGDADDGKTALAGDNLRDAVDAEAAVESVDVRDGFHRGRDRIQGIGNRE